MTMEIGTLQRILDKLFCSGGNTITYGGRAYQMHHNSTNTWICWLPLDEYKKNRTEYDNSPVGWYAFLRVA